MIFDDFNSDVTLTWEEGGYYCPRRHLGELYSTCPPGRLTKENIRVCY